jgi:hypothetical protein
MRRVSLKSGGLAALILGLTWVAGYSVSADTEVVHVTPPEFAGVVTVSELPVLKEKRDGVMPNVLDAVLKRGSVVIPSEVDPDPQRTTTVEMSTDGILAAVPAIDLSFDGPSEQIPPDPVVAAGLNHVLSVVNTVFEVYDKSGTLLQGPIDLATFFGIGGLALVFDPLVVYDPFEDRFILVVASDAALFQDSKLHIAFSQTSDPTGSWNKYAIDADAGQPFNNWADYPSIGIDFNAVYLTANMLPRSGGSTNTTIFVYDKRDGYADPPRALDNSHVIDVRDGSGNIAADLRPAYMDEQRLDDFYYLARTDESFGSVAAVITLSGARFTTPTINSYDVGLPGLYTGAPTARQSGGGDGIDAIGGILFNTVYRNGKIWAAHAFQDGLDISTWVHRFDVDTLPPTREQTYTVSESGQDIFLPHVFPDTEDNDFALVTGYSGPNTFVTGRYYNIDASGSLRHSEDLIAGEARNDTTRHGDYFSIYPDPADGNRLWMISQYMPTAGGPGNSIIASVEFETGSTPASPPPIPDGDSVAGTPLKVNESGGSQLTVTWDSACGATDHHLVWFDLDMISSYQIAGTECDAGTSGSWVGNPPSGNLSVLVVADDNVDTEGSYGLWRDGAALTERPVSISSCSITSKDISATCP